MPAAKSSTAPATREVERIQTGVRLEKRLLKVLKAVEWVFDYDKQKSVCPWCKAESRWMGFDIGEYGEHTPDCLRQRVLEKLGVV